MKGIRYKIDNCDYHDKRGVVAEIETSLGSVRLCYPVLRDAVRGIVKKYKDLGEDVEGDRNSEKVA